MNKLALDGLYPPPYGGVSVHIKRFISVLEEKNIPYTFFYSSTSKHFRKNFITCSYLKKLLFLFFGPYSLIHTHTQGFRHRLILPFIRIAGKKVILTLHSETMPLQYVRSRNILKKFYFFQLKKYDHIIVVNTHLKNKLIERGINSKKISVIPAFILPTADEYSPDNLPKKIIELREKTNFLITANSYKITLVDNQDLYGIDICIELTKRLVDHGFENFVFLFVIPDIGNFRYFYELKNLIMRYNLQDKFYFYTEPVNYTAVLHISDLFIRPTLQDGYGVSVTEALYLSVPALASNVCPRAEGTTVFQSRNCNDLFTKAVYIIENYEEHKNRLKSIKYINYADNILNVYDMLLNKK
jgi:hypothetical protein